MIHYYNIDKVFHFEYFINKNGLYNQIYKYNSKGLNSLREYYLRT